MTHPPPRPPTIPAAPLRIALGARPAGRADGLLLADDGVKFGCGDMLPFADRTVRAVHVARNAIPESSAGFLHLMLECRRVLAVNAALTVESGTPDAALSLLAVELARTAGLPRATERAAAPADVWQTTSGDPGAGSIHVFAKPERQCSTDPIVTICIPAFNPAFFAACLDSALAQTYPNVEVIVCDDSRADAIASIVDAAQRRVAGSHRLRYVRNERTLGTRRNFIRCLESSEGEFIKFLCDDDVLAPSCVDELLEGFRCVPDVTLSTSRRQRIDGAGRVLPDQPATEPIVSVDAVIAGTTLANAMLMVGLNRVGEPSTVLFRKADLLDQAPAYFGFCGDGGHGFVDLATWTGLLLKGDAVYRTSCLSSFRIHPGQRQHDPSKSARNLASLRSMQSTWLKLGLADTLAPDQLAVKPFPPATSDPWLLQPMLGLSARRVSSPPRTLADGSHLIYAASAAMPGARKA